LLRSLAGMEKLRKRTERQVADARDYGIASFARHILADAGHMEGALRMLDAAMLEKDVPGLKPQLHRVGLLPPEQAEVLGRRGGRKRSARLDAVTHGAEAGIGVFPGVGARDPDHLQIGAAAEAQPLYPRQRGSAGRVPGIGEDLMALLATDPQRLGRGDANIP